MSIQKTTTELETLKINYLTQEMYEDALENGEINEGELYFTPDKETISLSLSLPVANWSNNSQTITATGVTASNNVIISPAPASIDNYVAANIKCTAQAANSLTFTCTTTPTAAISVNVLVMN